MAIPAVAVAQAPENTPIERPTTPPNAWTVRAARLHEVATNGGLFSVKFAGGPNNTLGEMSYVRGGVAYNPSKFHPYTQE